MAPSRYAFHVARAREARQPAAFLTDACLGDDDLGHEVELRSARKSVQFLCWIARQEKTRHIPTRPGHRVDGVRRNDHRKRFLFFYLQRLRL
jgi:hypothetical protein